MGVLELAGVSAGYGDTAVLADVDLDIDPGHVVAVLGANGAGKSTLISVAAGLRRPEAGSVRVAGVDLRHDPVGARRRLGVAGQDVALYPTETLYENLQLFGALAGLRGPALASRVEEVAGTVGLEDVLGRRADRCSAGQRRRAHVVAAVLHRPEVLLLDEPAAHLDAPGRACLMRLAQTSADDGAAVCWCTNRADEAAAVAATVAILDRGRVLVRGAPSELARRLAPPVVDVRFDGPAPLATAPGLEVTGSAVRVAVTADTSAMAEALVVLSGHLGRVRSLRVVEPDLESAFATVTGREPVTGGEGAVAAEPGP